MRQNFSDRFCCLLSIRFSPKPQIYSCLRLGMGIRPATGAAHRSHRQSTALLTRHLLLRRPFLHTFAFPCLISTLRRRDSSVGAATRLRNGRSGGSIPLKARDFCLLHNVHTGSEAHGYENSFPGFTAAGAYG